MMREVQDGIRGMDLSLLLDRRIIIRLLGIEVLIHY